MANIVRIDLAPETNETTQSQGQFVLNNLELTEQEKEDEVGGKYLTENCIARLILRDKLNGVDTNAKDYFKNLSIRIIKGNND